MIVIRRRWRCCAHDICRCGDVSPTRAVCSSCLQTPCISAEMRVAAIEALRRHVAVSPVHRGIGREHYTPLWRGYHGCKEARWSKGWRQEAWWCQEAWWRQEARWCAQAPLGNALVDKEAGSRRLLSFSVVSHREYRPDASSRMRAISESYGNPPSAAARANSLSRSR